METAQPEYGGLLGIGKREPGVTGLKDISETPQRGILASAGQSFARSVMRQPRKKHVLTPEERKRRSKRLNMILMLIAIGWCVIMLSMNERIFIRWFAAIMLFLVGVIGYFGIGTERTRKTHK